MREVPVLKVSGVVLAGGMSRRLGMDKALLQLNGHWLLERIIKTLAVLSDDLLIVAGNRPEFGQLEARVVPDLISGTGPLGGIYSGLREMRYDRGVFVACDMPTLNLPFLRYMILLSIGVDVVIPRIHGLTEPLHAIYSKACVEPIEQLLHSDRLRVAELFSRVRVRYVTEEEVGIFDPDHVSFFNINTLDDLAKAERLSQSALKKSPGDPS